MDRLISPQQMNSLSPSSSLSSQASPVIPDHWFLTLRLLFFIEIAFHMCGVIINLMLFMTLKRSSSFHSHMRIIVRHICFVLVMASSYGALRSLTAFRDWFFMYQYQYRLKPPLESCWFSSSMPSSLCFILCTFFTLLAVERFYAMSKCRSYEEESCDSVINAMCIVLWIFTILLNIGTINEVINGRSNHFDCEFREIAKNAYQRNMYDLTVVFFAIVLIGAFSFLNKTCRAHEIDHVKYNYSTISARYQMKENITTSRFLTTCCCMISIFFFLPMMIDIYLFDENDSFLVKICKRELWYLVKPVFYLVFPCYFIYNFSRIYEKLWIYHRPKGKDMSLVA